MVELNPSNLKFIPATQTVEFAQAGLGDMLDGIKDKVTGGGGGSDDEKKEEEKSKY